VRQGKGCYWRGGSHRTPKPHLSLPPRDGGSSPQGVKGALLILLEASGSKSKACPLPGLPTHLPPLRRGRDGNCRGKLDLSCRCPRRAGEAAPKGLKGALLILICERQSNGFQDVIQPQQHLIVPEPQHAEALPPDAGVALCIRAGCEVLA